MKDGLCHDSFLLCFKSQENIALRVGPEEPTTYGFLQIIHSLTHIMCNYISYYPSLKQKEISLGVFCIERNNIHDTKHYDFGV